MFQKNLIVSCPINNLQTTPIRNLAPKRRVSFHENFHLPYHCEFVPVFHMFPYCDSFIAIAKVIHGLL